MKVEIIKNKYINWKLTLLGLVLWWVRTFSMNAFKVSPVDGSSYPTLADTGIWATWLSVESWFHPDAMHVSFFVSFMCMAALIFSLRSKVLNAFSFMLLPSLIVTIPTKEFVIWFSDKYTLFYKLNYVTVHLPVLIIGIYVFIHRRILVSKASAWIAGFMMLPWFLLLDNKENGILNGWHFFFVVLVVTVLYAFFMLRFLLNDPDPRSPDPLFAPLFKVVKE